MSSLALRVAARFAAMDAAKMEALLLKVRKGAVASLSMGNLGEIFTVLDPGWKLEKSVGLVKLYGRADNNDRAEAFFDKSKDDVERQRNLLGKDAVTSLPSSPKAGKLYVLDITEIKPGRDNTLYFEFKPWMGAEGWKITTSTGTVQEFYPAAYEFGNLYHGYKALKRKSVRAYEVIDWLNKNTDWLDQINKKLGLGTFEKAVPRTRESTGSCPVCFQNIKIKDEKMVLHGYRRPGTGTTHGSCFGVGYPAFELNVKGTKVYLDTSVEPSYKKIQQFVERLEQDKVDQIMTWDNKIVTRNDPYWSLELESVKRKAKRDLEYAEGTYKAYSKLVSNWKVRPLPKEGEPHIDWYFRGQKD